MRVGRTWPIIAEEMEDGNHDRWAGRQGDKETGRRARRQDAGCKMQDAGCKMQDAGCKMQDAGCKMQKSV